jgi:hypothetical protein
VPDREGNTAIDLVRSRLQEIAAWGKDEQEPGKQAQIAAVHQNVARIMEVLREHSATG